MFPSLTTIVKISKNAGSLIKPHIPVLVGALMESLSGLEPQVLNYITFHVGNDQSAQEKVTEIYWTLHFETLFEPVRASFKFWFKFCLLYATSFVMLNLNCSKFVL